MKLLSVLMVVVCLFMSSAHAAYTAEQNHLDRRN